LWWVGRSNQPTSRKSYCNPEQSTYLCTMEFKTIATFLLLVGCAIGVYCWRRASS
ncbi:unnamed protein product, partial [Heterosigma akashiwo]